MKISKAHTEKFHIRKAKEEDADQISIVLSDFYNMVDRNESLHTFKSELKKG